MANAHSATGAVLDAAPARIDRERLAVNSRDAMSIRFEPVHDTYALIIDDFYADPDYVRSLALELDFYRPIAGYPGRFAMISLAQRDIGRLLHECVADGYDVQAVPHRAYPDMTFAMVTVDGPDEVEPIHCQPHFDNFCDFAGIVYLNPDEQASGGTAFWRHRDSGLIAAPVETDPQIPELCERYGVADLQGVVRHIWTESMKTHHEFILESDETWERTKVVDMRFNRLVLYPGSLLHTLHMELGAFGDIPTTRRLTQNVYLSTVDQAATA
jgi:hypothetical protein